MSKVIIKSVLVCLVSIVIHGCAGKLPTYQDDQVLQPGNGWLLLPIQTPNKTVKFEFSSGLSNYNSPIYPFGNHTSVIQLPEGSYRISAFTINQVRFVFEKPRDYEDFLFRIEAGKVNYIGNLGFDGNTISIQNRLTNFSSLAYPDLIENYEVKYTHETAYK